MIMKKWIAPVALFVAVAPLAAQDGDVAGVPDIPAAAMPDSPQPMRTYENACGTCHDNRGFGVQVIASRRGTENALLHESNNMPPEVVRAIVRNGFGHMPPMSKIEVSDEELDQIVAMLEEVRVKGLGQ